MKSAGIRSPMVFPQDQNAPGNRSLGKRGSHSLQSLPDFLRELANVHVLDKLQNGFRIHERNGDVAVLLLAYDDIARQQQTDVGLRLDRAMGERRIARAENLVRATVDAKLLL